MLSVPGERSASGLSSFSGVIELKCFLMKSAPELSSFGLTEVPILKQFANFSLSESVVTGSDGVSFPGVDDEEPPVSLISSTKKSIRSAAVSFSE